MNSDPATVALDDLVDVVGPVAQAAAAHQHFRQFRFEGADLFGLFQGLLNDVPDALGRPVFLAVPSTGRRVVRIAVVVVVVVICGMNFLIIYHDPWVLTILHREKCNARNITTKQCMNVNVMF